MRPLLLALLACFLTGCSASSFLQPGDQVVGELTSDGGASSPLKMYVTLNLFRDRKGSRAPVPFSLGMGVAWPEADCEFIDLSGAPLGDKRHVQFEDGC